jgi:exosome complex component RRP4
LETQQETVTKAPEPSAKSLVLPGEQIELGTAKAGAGTHTEGGKVIATILGLKIEHKGVVSVVALSGVYVPRQGDTVIGTVQDLSPSSWAVGIGIAIPAPLHVNDVPWKVDFGDTARYIAVGDTVLCKVLKIDEVRRVFLTLNGPGLRKLEGGQVVEISYTNVGRVVGKAGATIERLKRWTNCRMFAARNGRVWIDGELPDMGVAIAAVKLIEREANSPNLSETLDAYLKEHGKEPAPAPEDSAAGTEPAGGADGGGFEEGPEGDDDENGKREVRANKEEE